MPSKAAGRRASPPLLLRAKPKSGGRKPRPASWLNSCLGSWQHARAVCAALLVAWLVAMHAPLARRDARRGGYPNSSNDNNGAGATPRPGGSSSDAPPGICARLAADVVGMELGAGGASSFSHHLLASSSSSSSSFPWFGRRREQPCSADVASTLSLAVVLVVAEEEDLTATAAMCARARATADHLHEQQTLGCYFDVALLVRSKVNQGMTCPGIRAFGQKEVEEEEEEEAALISTRQFVVFWPVDGFDATHRHRHHLQPAALEKMVLAAHGEDADVVSIDVGRQGAADDDISICIARPQQQHLEAGHDPRRRPTTICRSVGTPVLMRVPTWLSNTQLDVWASALVDALRSTYVVESLSSSVSEDALATLFCIGQDNESINARLLREALLVMLPQARGVKKTTPPGNVRSVDSRNQRRRRLWCERPPMHASQAWANTIADAYIARAYVGVGEDGGGTISHAAALPAPQTQDQPRTLDLFQVTPTTADHPGFLLIVPWLEHGGADQFNVNLARELTRLSVHVVVVTTLSSPNPTARDFYAISPDVFHLPDLVTSPKDTALVLDVLLYLIQSRNVEVVMVSHSALGYRLLPSLRQALMSDAGGGKSKVKLVDFVHLEEMEWGDGGYAAMSVAYAPHLDHTFAASEHVKTWMMATLQQQWKESQGGEDVLSSHHITVAYIGVDSHLLQPLPPRARLLARHALFGSQAVTATTPVVAYLARMVDQKLPALYFEIVRQLREERKLVFASVAIGGGALLGELRTNLSRLRSDLDRSESDQRQHKPPHLALGMLDHDAAVRVLAASDILLLPSRNEGIALAVYEAMALGVTPVVSAVGGQCELVSGEAGACIVADEVANDHSVSEAATAFVDELEMLIRSPKLLNERRRAARRRVKQGGFTMGNTLSALGRGLGC